MTTIAESCTGCGLDQMSRDCRIRRCSLELNIENICPCRTCVVKITCRVICNDLNKYSDKIFKYKNKIEKKK